MTLINDTTIITGKFLKNVTIFFYPIIPELFFNAHKLKQMHLPPLPNSVQNASWNTLISLIYINYTSVRNYKHDRVKAQIRVFEMVFKLN